MFFCLSLSIYLSSTYLPLSLYVFLSLFLCLSAHGLTNEIADFLEIQYKINANYTVSAYNSYLSRYYPASDRWMSSSASILSKQFSDITECLQGIKNWLCNNDLEVERAHRWQQKAIRDQVSCGIWFIVCICHQCPCVCS